MLDIPTFILANSEINKMAGGLSTLLDERWKALQFLILSEVSSQANKNQDLVNLFPYAYNILSRETTPRSVQYIHSLGKLPLKIF